MKKQLALKSFFFLFLSDVDTYNQFLNSKSVFPKILTGRFFGTPCIFLHYRLKCTIMHYELCTRENYFFNLLFDTLFINLNVLKLTVKNKNINECFFSV